MSCEENCAPAEPNVVAVAAAIDVDAACAYSGEMRRTTCTFSAVAAEGAVRTITVPASTLCAAVVEGDFEAVSLGANARPEAGGLRSTQAEGATAVVTVELAGEVTIAATATYWCETDGAGLVPVTGPGLRCESLEATAGDTRATTGTIFVQTYACDGGVAEADANWFQMCDALTVETSFRLDRRDGDGWVDPNTQATDAEGLCRFSELPPGTYRLDQSDGSWCHAESDRVDEQGNIIVEAGARSTVWVFSCLVP